MKRRLWSIDTHDEKIRFSKNIKNIGNVPLRGEVAAEYMIGESFLRSARLLNRNFLLWNWS